MAADERRRHTGANALPGPLKRSVNRPAISALDSTIDTVGQKFWLYNNGWKPDWVGNGFRVVFAVMVVVDVEAVFHWTVLRKTHNNTHISLGSPLAEGGGHHTGVPEIS